jgi:predicted glycosyltransferase
MSEQNVSDKLAKVITSIFEKIENIQGLILISTSFFIIGSTVSLINFYFIKNIYSKNDEQIKLLKNINNNLSRITQDNNFINFKVYEEFQKKINIIADFSVELKKQSNKLLEQFEENIEKKYITTTTSMSDFEQYFKEMKEEENITKVDAKYEDAEVYKDIDNELVQECYDNLPCSNIKQTTSYGFFYWK